MNDLTIFESPEFGSIRTVEEDGKVLFCGNDVAKALGYKRPADAITTHCKWSVIRRLPTAGGEQSMKFIPEGDVYRLAAKSELPGAERFESWIFDEVIPSIRRTGGYIAGQKELSPAELMAKALKVANDVLAAREARISELTVQNTIMQPKADYFDELVDRNLLTSFRDTAKQLGVSQNAFIGFLKERKYIYRDQKGKLMPYAEKNNGLFEVKECFNNKTEWSGVQTMVTPKGRETFRLLLEGCKKEA